MLRLECRVGHAFSTESVLASQAETIENTLWRLINLLEERATTLRRMAELVPHPVNGCA